MTKINALKLQNYILEIVCVYAYLLQIFHKYAELRNWRKNDKNTTLFAAEAQE